jgi:hypothetical protein
MHYVHLQMWQMSNQAPNHSVNSDAQLRCATLGAGYAGRWA